MRYLALVLLATAACQQVPAAPAAPSAVPTAALVAALPPSAAPSVVPSTVATCPPTTSKSRIAVGGQSIPVDLAYTDATRQTGLSGRPCLAAGTGLVIGWDKPTPARIWMPDMNFAIDVIFVRDAKIVMIRSDAQPCVTIADCPTFGPGTPIDYVLEVPAGSAKTWGLKQNDPIKLTK